MWMLLEAIRRLWVHLDGSDTALRNLSVALKM